MLKWQSIQGTMQKAIMHTGNVKRRKDMMKNKKFLALVLASTMVVSLTPHRAVQSLLHPALLRVLPVRRAEIPLIRSMYIRMQ